jgi:hypothetical protein
VDQEPEGRFPTIAETLVGELESFSTSGVVQMLYQKFFRKYTCPNDALLYVPSHAARELDKDLEAAGIPKMTKDGKVAFHALRTSFVTLTYEAGATHKEAQALARHSTPQLTTNTYGRARDERLAGITEKVAETVLSGDFGANLVHEMEISVTQKADNCLMGNTLTLSVEESGRQDLNLRPHDPQSCALAKLRHAPIKCGHCSGLAASEQAFFLKSCAWRDLEQTQNMP